MSNVAIDGKPMTEMEQQIWAAAFAGELRDMTKARTVPGAPGEADTVDKIPLLGCNPKTITPDEWRQASIAITYASNAVRWHRVLTSRI